MLRTQYPFIFVRKTHLCDICNHAKQKKLLFTLNTSKTIVVFNLIHIDICGPCSINSMQDFRYFFTIVDDFLVILGLLLVLLLTLKIIFILLLKLFVRAMILDLLKSFPPKGLFTKQHA